MFKLYQPLIDRFDFDGNPPKWPNVYDSYGVWYKTLHYGLKIPALQGINKGKSRYPYYKDVITVRDRRIYTTLGILVIVLV